MIATRESRLALWQAEHVRALVREHCALDARLLGMTTRGDEILDRTLSKVGGKGLFVKELETALEERRADLAVHSLKDVPMDLPDGFELAAVLEREDPRDASRVVAFRNAGRVATRAPASGTSSLRRVVQLLSLRPDLRSSSCARNLDTRLRKLDEGQLRRHRARCCGPGPAGNSRRASRSASNSSRCCRAAGQGALGCRSAQPIERLSAARPR